MTFPCQLLSDYPAVCLCLLWFLHQSIKILFYAPPVCICVCLRIPALQLNKSISIVIFIVVGPLINYLQTTLKTYTFRVSVRGLTDCLGQYKYAVCCLHDLWKIVCTNTMTCLVLLLQRRGVCVCVRDQLFSVVFVNVNV